MSFSMPKDTSSWPISVCARSTFTRESLLGPSVERLNTWRRKFWLARAMEKPSIGGVSEPWCTICSREIRRLVPRTGRRRSKQSSRANWTFQPTSRPTLAIWFVVWWSDKSRNASAVDLATAWRFVRILSSRTSIGRMSSIEISSRRSSRFW